MKTRWPDNVEPITIRGDEAHVWVVSVAVRQSDLDELWSTLDVAERDRAASFRFEDSRRQFVVARGALRKLLGEYLCVPPAEIELMSDQHGKPQLAVSQTAARLRFNISHSGNLALIAVADGCEVGVDIEQLHRVGHLEQIARRFFHPEEAKEVLGTQVDLRDLAFLRCWTRKEAVLKAFGAGITGLLADFQVPTNEKCQTWVELPARPQVSGKPRCWLQHLKPCDGYVGAIACVESERRVRSWTFTT
jgi:4'-phosphopantetheinyl transferase